MPNNPPSAAPIEAFTFEQPDRLFGSEPRRLLAWRHDDQFVSHVYHQGYPGGMQYTQHFDRDVHDVIEEIAYGATNAAWSTPALLPGEFHPRIWRNGISDTWIQTSKKKRIPCYKPYFHELRARCIALHRIQNMLASVFEVVTPGQQHDDVSGGALRQLLLLSAVEVEGLLKGTYLANFAGTPSGPLNINAYARLARPMRLDEWTASFSYFDEAGVARPFGGWAPNHPPSWWTAYNALKHEPEQPIRYRDALDCCLAIRVLLEAQFGPYCERLIPDAGLAAMEVGDRPAWAPDELYYPSISTHTLGAHRSKPLF